MSDKQKILLGITGGIAAYKSVELLRLLTKADYEVQIVCTPAALEFVGAPTWRSLSGNVVAVESFAAADKPISHISLAKDCDLAVIAPCTANTFNKIAQGFGDNLLTTTILSLPRETPLLIAPAMNTAMWLNSTTQESIKLMNSYGISLVGPQEGDLACGDTGQGRMVEPEQIFDKIVAMLEHSAELAGQNILITAGATKEYIDPVRYITSPASGLTGVLIAAEAAARGAAVTLVAADGVRDKFANTLSSQVKLIEVISADDMYTACASKWLHTDAAIFTAAVGDYAAKKVSTQKLKRAGKKDITLNLVQNVDIAAKLGARKARSGKPGRKIIAFAAETEDIVANAQLKLQSKQADLIVANDVSNPEVGFGSVENEVYFIYADEEQPVTSSGRITKQELARRVVDYLV